MSRIHVIFRRPGIFSNNSYFEIFFINLLDYVFLFNLKILLLLFFTGGLAAAGTRMQACSVFGPMLPTASDSTPISAGDDSDGDGVEDLVDQCRGVLTGGFDFDQAGCPTRFDYLHGLNFDDALHRRWYDRFWNGRCEGFGFFDFCIEDGTSWNLTTADLVAHLTESDQSRARGELWALGRLIGYEWAKRNDIRKISTSDLQSWRKVIESPGEPWSKIRQLCQNAESALRSTR